jgi:hypothetical protein
LFATGSQNIIGSALTSIGGTFLIAAGMGLDLGPVVDDSTKRGLKAR